MWNVSKNRFYGKPKTMVLHSDTHVFKIEYYIVFLTSSICIFEIYLSYVYSVITNFILISNYIFRSCLIMSMNLPTPFFITYPVWFTLPYSLSDLLPTDLFPYAEAYLAVNDLIRAITNKATELQTIDTADHFLIIQSAKIAFLTFRGKPIAMAMCQQNIRRVALVSRQLTVTKPRSSKRLTVPQVRYFKDNVFLIKMDGSRDFNRIFYRYDSDTRVECASFFCYDRVRFAIITTQYGVYLSILRFFDRRSWRANRNSCSCVGCRFIFFTGLTFPMLKRDAFALFIYTTFIIPKLT